jgi:glutaminyl-tRNA synthetase
VQLVDDGTVTRTVAKDVFVELLQHGGDPVQIVREKGLEQLTDASSLEPLVDKVIAENESKVAEYHSGRTGLFGFFVGQVMRESGGKANPALVKELVQKRLA